MSASSQTKKNSIKKIPNIGETIQKGSKKYRIYKPGNNIIPTKNNTAPQILFMKWGEIQVYQKGKIKIYKGQHKSDTVLKPDSHNIWNWKNDGTKHDPGTSRTAIIQNKLSDNVDYIIISLGQIKSLKLNPRTKRLLEKYKKNNKIKNYFVLPSYLAAEKYNNYVANGKRVSMLLHSTC